MAKIARYNGDLKAFASSSTGTERTVFGDTTQSDTLDANINADFLTGWEIVAVNDAPSKQDFNGLAYTMSQVLAYLHQMGVAEWNTAQEYHAGAVATIGGVVYMSTTNTNTGNNPATDYTNWKDISGGRTVVATTDATVTAISTIAVPENSCITIKATINGIIDDYSAACGGTILYSARRIAAGAVEVDVPTVSVHNDSAGAPTIDADVDGNNLRLLVTGVLAENWAWSCSYNYNFVV